jgi:DNA-binding transcriptional LysR family regulator
VRKLEEYLGVKLFERNRARVAVTDDGEKVLRLAHIVVGATDDILRILRTRMREKFLRYVKPTRGRKPAPHPLSLRKSIIAGKPNR